MKGISFLFAVLAWSVGVLPGRADVRLPAIFSDHMVLQGGVSVPVWGWAEPGEVVTIEVAGRSRTTRADADGKWKVQLDTLKAANRPQTFIARGANTLTVRDVLIGEVWLGSGQSNMGMQVRGGLYGSIDRADEEVAAANYPAIRMFFQHEPGAIDAWSVPPEEPLSDRPGEWRVCSPETVADFSALGYFFARDLHNEIGMPVGIINVSAGNSPIEAWTSRDAQQAEPALAPVLEDWRTRLAAFDPASEERKSRDAKEHWLKQRAEATRKNEAAPKAPAPFENPAVMAPGGLFNARIAPLVPYAIRGVIWSQGERNALGPLTGLYGTQLKTMIDDWRARWGSEMYFAWVQLPGSQKPQRAPSEPAGWGVSVREGMRRALAVPRTGMAITIDLGGEKAGHPTNKADFAARLSLLVLHDVYGKPIEIWSGPLFHTAKHDGHAMVLTFDHAMGLKASSGELEGFAIAGEDGKFVWARARIDGETVIASSDAVPEPAAVRYGWAANPKGNLVNAAGLPASPFRTDQWKEVPPLPLAAARPEPNDAAQAAAQIEPSLSMEGLGIGEQQAFYKRLPTAVESKPTDEETANQQKPGEAEEEPVRDQGSQGDAGESGTKPGGGGVAQGGVSRPDEVYQVSATEARIEIDRAKRELADEANRLGVTYVEETHDQGGGFAHTEKGVSIDPERVRSRMEAVGNVGDGANWVRSGLREELWHHRQELIEVGRERFERVYTALDAALNKAHPDDYQGAMLLAYGVELPPWKRVAEFERMLALASTRPRRRHFCHACISTQYAGIRDDVRLPHWRTFHPFMKELIIHFFYGRGIKPGFAGDALTLARFNLERLNGGKDAGR